MNSVNIIANLTRDPELKPTSSDTAVCSMRVAINGRAEKPAFIDVTAFGKLGETCHAHLRSGARVAIGARIASSEWHTDGGDKRSRIELIASDISFLSRKDSADEATDPEPAGKDS
jgi:single-strand DNA-binding protein